MHPAFQILHGQGMTQALVIDQRIGPQDILILTIGLGLRTVRQGVLCHTDLRPTVDIRHTELVYRSEGARGILVTER